AIAAAPDWIAGTTKRWPSTRSPLTATNRLPEATALESSVTDITERLNGPRCSRIATCPLSAAVSCATVIELGVMFTSATAPPSQSSLGRHERHPNTLAPALQPVETPVRRRHRPTLRPAAHR